VDTLNRILVATMALAIAAGAIVGFLVVTGIAGTSLAPAGWLRDGLSYLDGYTGSDRVWAGVIAAAVVAGGLLLAVWEARPLWGENSYVQVDAEGAPFKLYPRTIEQIIEHEGTMVRGVSTVRSSLKQNGDGLEINCGALVQPATDIPQAGSELRERIHSAVEQMTGIPVANVNLTMGMTKQKSRVL
jgi:uncharacterized alkaline shock family protein YloU